MNNFEDDYFTNVYAGDYTRRNPPYKWKAFLRKITIYKSKDRLLDVGCATGLFLEQALHYFDCEGCDISSYALREAQSRLPVGVKLYNNPIEKMVGHDSYDVIKCFDVIEHIQELEVVFNHIYQLQKKDGYIAITVPVYDGPLGWLVNRMDKDQTHVYRQSRAFWLEQIRKWFRTEYYAGVWRYFFYKRYYFTTISRWTRAWTTAIYIIAKK